MSYDNPRIRLETSAQDIIVAMSEGNPGAVSVLIQIVKSAEAIDPDSALGWLGPMASWLRSRSACRSS